MKTVEELNNDVALLRQVVRDLVPILDYVAISMRGDSNADEMKRYVDRVSGEVRTALERTTPLPMAGYGG